MSFKGQTILLPPMRVGDEKAVVAALPLVAGQTNGGTAHARCHNGTTA